MILKAIFAIIFIYVMIFGYVKIRSPKLDAKNINIIGKKSVNTAIKAGIVSEHDIKEIQGIPFALVLM